MELLAEMWNHEPQALSICGPEGQEGQEEVWVLAIHVQGVIEVRMISY